MQEHSAFCIIHNHIFELLTFARSCFGLLSRLSSAILCSVKATLVAALFNSSWELLRKYCCRAWSQKCCCSGQSHPASFLDRAEAPDHRCPVPPLRSNGSWRFHKETARQDQEGSGVSAGQGAPQHRVPPAAAKPGEPSSSGGSGRVSHSLRTAREDSSGETGLGSHQEVKRARPGWAEVAWARSKARAWVHVHSQAGGQRRLRERRPQTRLFTALARNLGVSRRSRVQCHTAAPAQSRRQTQAGKPCAGWRACRQEGCGLPAAVRACQHPNGCPRQAGIPPAGLLPPLPQASISRRSYDTPASSL